MTEKCKRSWSTWRILNEIKWICVNCYHSAHDSVPVHSSMINSGNSTTASTFLELFSKLCYNNALVGVEFSKHFMGLCTKSGKI